MASFETKIAKILKRTLEKLDSLVAREPVRALKTDFGTRTLLWSKDDKRTKRDHNPEMDSWEF